MPRHIFLVAHGKKEEGPNPGLSPLGKYQVTQLKPYLPANPKVIACGTGKRHLDTAKALKLSPTRYSFIFGAPESKNRGKNTVILADGTEIAYELYTSVADRAELFVHLTNLLPANSIVITSRSTIKLLMKEGNPKAVAVYRYEPNKGELIELFAISDDTGEKDNEV